MVQEVAARVDVGAVVGVLGREHNRDAGVDVPGARVDHRLAHGQRDRGGVGIALDELRVGRSHVRRRVGRALEVAVGALVLLAVDCIVVRLQQVGG